MAKVPSVLSGFSIYRISLKVQGSIHSGWPRLSLSDYVYESSYKTHLKQLHPLPLLYVTVHANNSLVRTKIEIHF